MRAVAGRVMRDTAVMAVDRAPRGIRECLIIGPGPAGLVAATYLARYRRDVCVIDGGDSRAASAWSSIRDRKRASPGCTYAAGDVVASLGQIAVAVSEACVAATSIHDSLPANFR